MRRIALAALLLLALPAPAAATGAAPAPKAPAAPLAGLQEWNNLRAESRKVIASLKAEPARAKAAAQVEKEWLALDAAVQKVGTLHAQGRLDPPTARASAAELERQLGKFESAARAITAPGVAPTAPSQTFAHLLSSIGKAFKSVVSGISKAAA